MVSQSRKKGMPTAGVVQVRLELAPGGLMKVGNVLGKVLGAEVCAWVPLT